jgi:hypothetical protein
MLMNLTVQDKYVHKFIRHTTQLKPNRKDYDMYVYPFLPNDSKIYTAMDEASIYSNLNFIIPTQTPRGARWHSWLRHYATNRNVAGSIPDGVIGIFHWHNRFGRTMALGSTQPLTEMNTRNISWGVKAAGA